MVVVGCLVSVRSTHVGEEHVFGGKYRVLAVREFEVPYDRQHAVANGAVDLEPGRRYVCLSGYEGFPWEDDVRVVA